MPVGFVGTLLRTAWKRLDALLDFGRLQLGPSGFMHIQHKQSEEARRWGYVGTHQERHGALMPGACTE